MLRVWRIAATRANFGIWQADSHDDLHAALGSLPLHPFMQVTVTPLVEHPVVAAAAERGVALGTI